MTHQPFNCLNLRLNINIIQDFSPSHELEPFLQPEYRKMEILKFLLVKTMKKYPLLMLNLMFLLLLPFSQSARATPAQPPDAEAIADYLQVHPALTETGTQVLEVYFQGEALVIDLSADILPEGVYEESVFTHLQADLDEAFQVNQYFMTTFKIEGLVLEEWGRPLPDFSVRAEPPAIQAESVTGPLSGVKVALSAGHGLYWNEDLGEWRYQRIEFWGIREDTLNSEIMYYVQAALLTQGATVIQLRELDREAGFGVTGYPKWHEGARQYAISKGLPSWVWDGSTTNYNSDIRARPYMSNYYGADLLISLHNNGWNGTLTGTETYYDTDNHPGSPGFAQAVHNRVISTIRSEYDSAWVSRGVKSSDNNYGEINYAQMPAILLELAFMDRQFPDNTYLHDETFKQLAARAIVLGICDYQGVICADFSSPEPNVLEKPALNPIYGSGMCDSGWYRYLNPRGQYAYLMLNTAEPVQSLKHALWQPLLPTIGEYQLEVFIPPHDPIAWQCPPLNIATDTGQAIYAISHANGTSAKMINQAAVPNQWVTLGTYHFDSENQAVIALSDLTWELTGTHTVSASALRFSLVDHAGVPFHDTDWLPTAWLTEQSDAPAEHILNFLTLHHSCMAAPMLDADGEEIDIPAVLGDAAATHQVNPRLLLTIMEAESRALSQCPDASALANLMGQSPASTALEQITDAALMLRQAMDALSTSGVTPNGWATGTSKTTLDGVIVTPATDAVTVLFDYTQNAGAQWGGTNLDEPGVWTIYAAWQDYHLDQLLPQAIYYQYIPLYQR